MNSPTQQEERAAFWWAKAFARDESGVTITEFIITLPIVIILFAGIVELGELTRQSVMTWSIAHGNVFDKSLDIQRINIEDFADGSGQMVNVDDDQMAALSPMSASAKALTDLEEYPPAVETTRAKVAVVASETSTYVGLQQGFLGGSHGRLAGPNEVLGSPPVTGAIRNGDEIAHFVGGGDQGSAYSRSLLNDALDTSVLGQGQDECGDWGNADTRGVISGINEGLSASGARPMLGAGLLYGSVTGVQRNTVLLGGVPVEVSAHYNMTLPTRRPAAPALQSMMSTMVTRLAMEDCSQRPYIMLLGIEAREPVYPRNIGNDALEEIPQELEEDVGIGYPLNYPWEQ